MIQSKILIVGNANDNHLIKFAKNFQAINKDKILLDIINIGPTIEDQPYYFNSIYNCSKFFYHKLYSIKFLRLLFCSIDYYVCFLGIPQYDLINIHYLTPFSLILLPLYKIKSTKIMITPWGSDVYRINSFYTWLYSFIYYCSDYVSVPPIFFREIVRRKFKVKDSKFVDLSFGSDVIDVINKCLITQNQAKSILSFDPNYVIACGYNRRQEQNHLLIINTLSKIKSCIPRNTVLLFLMTYGDANSDYIDQISSFLQKNNFLHKFVFDFLSPEEMCLYIKSCDLFIHLQETDAFSGTLQEFLLSGCPVINAEWLSYPDLEKFGQPYYIVNKQNIVNKLSQFFNGEIKKINISTNLKQEIANRGWSKKIDLWYKFYSTQNINEFKKYNI